MSNAEKIEQFKKDWDLGGPIPLDREWIEQSIDMLLHEIGKREGKIHGMVILLEAIRDGKLGIESAREGATNVLNGLEEAKK